VKWEPKATEWKRPLKIGKFYRVECVKTQPDSGGSKMWLPIYGPMHVDEANTGTDENVGPHIHVDMRFLDSEELRHMYFSPNDSGAIRLNISKENLPNAVLSLKRELRKCRRQWGVWSSSNLASSSRRDCERQYSNCKGCETCPHQNFYLTTVETSIVQGQEVKICPGHNLAWSVDTGELVPRN